MIVRCDECGELVDFAYTQSFDGIRVCDECATDIGEDYYGDCYEE